MDLPANSKKSASTADECYAPDRVVTNVDNCLFYHTIELPDHGVQVGQWDLREGIGPYLGDFNWGGRRVLELGAANGFVTWALEKRGAEVVCVDLSEHQTWDHVPFSGTVPEADIEGGRKVIRQLNKAWWLTKSQLQLKARVVYSTVYEVPSAIGTFDAAFFGCILQHLRDPFLALQRAASFGPEAIIVTEVMPEPVRIHHNLIDRVLNKVRGRSNFGHPRIEFLPRGDTRMPKDTWWRLGPEIICQFLGVLGFENCTVTRHLQRCNLIDHPADLFTVVGRRK